MSNKIELDDHRRRNPPGCTDMSGRPLAVTRTYPGYPDFTGTLPGLYHNFCLKYYLSRMYFLMNFQYINYAYGTQERDTGQDLVVRGGRRADPPIHDAYEDGGQIKPPISLSSAYKPTL